MAKKSGPDAILRRFLDGDGLLTAYPAKLSNKRIVLRYLAGHFESGAVYSEKDVSERLASLHHFQDWATLRRDMVDLGFMKRSSDGRQYQLTEQAGAGANAK